MNIISDVDGCIFKFTENFLEFYNNKYNTNYKYSDMLSYHFPENGIPQEKVKEFYNSVNNLDHYYTTKYILSYINDKLKDSIILITSIPNVDSIKKQRETNLETKKIVYDNIIYDDDKLKYLFRLSPVRLIIEDNPEHIERYLEHDTLFNWLLIPLHPWTRKYLLYNHPKIKVLDLENCNYNILQNFLQSIK